MTIDYFYEENRIYAIDDFLMLNAEATFPYQGDNIVNINHVFVATSLRGQGIASELMHKVYDEIKKRGLKVLPTCPYAIAWFKRNKDKQDILLDAKELGKSS